MGKVRVFRSALDWRTATSRSLKGEAFQEVLSGKVRCWRGLRVCRVVPFGYLKVSFFGGIGAVRIGE
jgi:hypothetical protein